MILDGSFLLDLRAGDADAVRLAADLDASAKPQRVPAVVVFELFAALDCGGVRDDGAARSRREPLLDVVESKEIVPVDRVVAVKAARLYDGAAAGGTRITALDCLIAATALTVEEPVVTRNDDHFERFDGLTVRAY